MADMVAGAVRLIKKLAEPSTDLLDDVVVDLRTVGARLVAGEEAAARTVADLAGGGLPLEAMTVPQAATSGADELLTGIYGDLYHTDDSTLARTYSRSLTSIPTQWHRLVAEDMAKVPDGGIWVGDHSIADFDHEVWKNIGAPPPGYNDWSEAGGRQFPSHHALFLGTGINGQYTDGPPMHEFGHSLDQALGLPSVGMEFTKVYARVMNILLRDRSTSLDYFTNPVDGRGKRELFAEGFAWFYQRSEQHLTQLSSTGERSFMGSTEAGRHVTEYLQNLESRFGITS
ncbi:hypothetical protein ACFXO9_30935 [Nocardia tengchongensis]|uniref:hypothetical protein n=1 Tax=Nocardia tengchongensis TaxID=2055889 RepID=UPI00369E8E68